MAAPATRLLLIRHGESEWNRLGRWQGSADVGLTDEGRIQAAVACERLGSFDAIWSSDLQRASHTAAIISEHLGVGPVRVDARLRETDVGQWQGLTLAEIDAGWPGYLAARRRPDSAEPLDAVVARVSAALADIGRETPTGEVLVITHAGVIRALRAALGAPDDRFSNLAGSWFHLQPNRAMTVQETVELIAHPAVVSEAL